jgi:hypothetical protein
LREPEARYLSNNTPWGRANVICRVAEGLFSVFTFKDGGFWVAPDRLSTMPAILRRCAQPFAAGPWFHEDASWCAVALAWPEEFCPEDRERAQVIFENYYAPWFDEHEPYDAAPEAFAQEPVRMAG